MRGGVVTGLVLVVAALVVRYQGPQSAAAPALTPSTPGPAARLTDVHAGLLYGRLTAIDGTSYEGRLRWGRDQEAFWSDYFNGAKAGNPWSAYAAAHEEQNPVEIFGFTIGGRDHGNSLRRLFLARFGDIAHIDAHFRDVQVRLKSGTVVALDRFAAGDIDDGVRVWDITRGIVDLDTRQIRSIDFLAAPSTVTAPDRLRGRVRTRDGAFSGLIQWDQQGSIGADELRGRTAGGEVRLRYDSISSIARSSPDTALVTLLDGSEMVLSGDRGVGHNNRGVYVDDGRYGRVLISWDAFARVDFTANGIGPAYDHYSPGHALAGRVSTRDGRRLTGRLVYDFDESETTETLDAAIAGVDYNIPFSLIRSVVRDGGDGRGAPHATVILNDGEALQLERTGDLGDRNAGILIFADGRERPENVLWADVAQIDFFDSAGGHRGEAPQLESASIRHVGRHSASVDVEVTHATEMVRVHPRPHRRRIPRMRRVRE